LYFYDMILLHGEINETSTKAFLNQIEDGPLDISIDSPGGDLFAGLRIYNAILNHPHETNIVVDGVAGSIASVIALAADNTTISKTGSFMIHNALVPQTSGNHHDLKKVANTLEQYSNIIAGVYADRTNLSHEEAVELMNNEQTFTAEDAVSLGFAKEIIEPLKAVAFIKQIDMSLLDTIKKGLKNEGEPAPVAVEETPVTEEVENAMFSPEQLEEIQSIVAAMIAEAMAGSPSTEEMGATIATVLNSITSKGQVETSGNITAPDPVATGIEAFNKKMNEIKNKA